MKYYKGQIRSKKVVPVSDPIEVLAQWDTNEISAYVREDERDQIIFKGVPIITSTDLRIIAQYFQRTDSSAPTPADTTGWQTYQNKSYNFEIWVPQDWVIGATPQEQWTYFASPQLKAKRDENEKNCSSPDPSKRKNCLLSMESAWDLVFRIDDREISEAMGKVGINNRVWHRQETADWGTIVTYSLQKDDDVYNFFAPRRNEGMLIKILSTFKFIE